MLHPVPFAETWSDFHRRDVYILINFTSLEEKKMKLFLALKVYNQKEKHPLLISFLLARQQARDFWWANRHCVCVFALFQEVQAQ